MIPRDGSGVMFLVTDDRSEYPAKVAVTGGDVQRLMRGPAVVSNLEQAKDGRMAVVYSTDAKSPEIYAFENGEVRALSHQNDALLAELNRKLCAENEHGMFVTGVCGVLDPASGELLYASAGHGPPLRVRSGHAPRQLTVDGGPILALFEHADFPVNKDRLEPGECLVAFTDGVTDAMNMDGAISLSFNLLGRVVNAVATSAPPVI